MFKFEVDVEAFEELLRRRFPPLLPAFSLLLAPDEVVFEAWSPLNVSGGARYPVRIIDLTVAQSPRSVSRARRANFGGSRSWSGTEDEPPPPPGSSSPLFGAIRRPLPLTSRALAPPEITRAGRYCRCSPICRPTVCTKKRSRCSPRAFGRRDRSVASRRRFSKANRAGWQPPISALHLHFSQQSQ